MGRAFEYRKARKMKRWGQMAKTFTKIGREIDMAVKASGPDPETNSRLRALIQNARHANMPKDNVERAIKRAISKEQADYKEVTFEGYGPYGVAIVVECATDNNQRSVANVRSYFNKYNGSLGTSGCLDFIFDRKCVFKTTMKEGLDLEELELELIDLGLDELYEDEGELNIYGEFEAFGKIQKFLEENNYEILRSEFERIPTDFKELTPEQEEELQKLLDKFDEDDDVQNVYHNMK